MEIQRAIYLRPSGDQSALHLFGRGEADAKLLDRLRAVLGEGDPAVQLTLLLDLYDRHTGKTEAA